MFTTTRGLIFPWQTLAPLAVASGALQLASSKDRARTIRRDYRTEVTVIYQAGEWQAAEVTQNSLSTSSPYFYRFNDHWHISATLLWAAQSWLAISKKKKKKVTCHFCQTATDQSVFPSPMFSLPSYLFLIKLGSVTHEKSRLWQALQEYGWLAKSLKMTQAITWWGWNSSTHTCSSC